jgi:hypothetical protein
VSGERPTDERTDEQHDAEQDRAQNPHRVTIGAGNGEGNQPDDKKPNDGSNHCSSLLGSGNT